MLSTKSESSPHTTMSTLLATRKLSMMTFRELYVLSCSLLREAISSKKYKPTPRAGPNLVNNKYGKP